MLLRCACLALTFLTAASACGQNIKFEQYQLGNGMSVILHEDHTLPLAAVNIWYRVGSKDEVERRSGFAHLFEHLMFMGTQRVPGNAFDTIMEGGGGANNASTAFDRTNYYSHGPANLLPTLLWLDADRLEDLARTMTQEKLDRQRDIVRNERRQTTENTPYGKAELLVEDLLYPLQHPYHHPIIGSHEDLEAATLQDVKDFFANHYVPNNGTLCVAGDFDSTAIKPLIAKLFGDLPRGPETPKPVVTPVELDGVKRGVTLDAVPAPALLMAFHAPPIYAPGDAEMSLVARILTDGKSSRLFQRLVLQEKLAAEVRAYGDQNLLDTMFRVDVIGVAGADLERIEKIVDEELSKLLKDGVTAEELERYKSGVEREKVAALQSIENRADKLNEYNFYLGDPNGFTRDLERFRKASLDSVKNTVSKVINLQKRVIVRVLPEQAPRTDSARDARPDLGAPHAFKLPAPETAQLSNGMKLMVWPRPELPLVNALLVFQPGGAVEPAAKAGVTSLLAEMLTEGAGDRDAAAFASAAQLLGAEINTGADHESFSASLEVLRGKLEPAAALLADALRRPRMQPADWERVQRLHLENLSQQEEEPAAVAAKVAVRALFGRDHPYGHAMDGEPAVVRTFTLDDIKAQQARLLRPETATLLLAGDITLKDAQALFEKLLGDWHASGPAPEAIAVPKLIPAEKTRVLVVDRPDAVQTMEQVILPAPPLNNPQRVEAYVLNTIVGGSFTSRLNQNLRENKGYTYGARSRFHLEPSTGYFTAGAAIRADVTGAGLKEILGELQRTASGDMAAAEAAKAVELVRSGVVQRFANQGAVIAQAADLLLAKLPLETVGQDMAKLPSVNAEQLNKFVTGALPMQRAIIVLVGDRKRVVSDIQSLNLPQAEIVDPYGEPIKE